MPFAGGSVEVKDWKTIKVIYTAQFEKVVKVPVNSWPSEELVGEYLGVAGDFDFNVVDIKPETLAIVKMEEA